MQGKKLALCLLGLLCLTAQAEATKIAVVLSRSLAPYQAALSGFSAKASYDLVRFNMEGKEAEGHQIMEKIAGGGFDLVVTIGSEATALAAKTLPDIPLVYTMLLEKPDMKGLKATGVLLDARIEDKARLLKKVFPQVAKVGVIYNQDKSGKIINQARQAMGAAGLTLIPIAITSQSEFSGALSKMTKGQVDMIWSVPDALTIQPEAVKATIAQGLNEKLPFVAVAESHVTAGALATFSVDYMELGAQTLELVKDVLNGKDVMPVYYPKQLILYVNTTTQAKLGLGDFRESPELKIIKK